MKQETKVIIANDPIMSQYLEDLLLVQADKKPHEIRCLFSDVFEKNG